MRRQRGKERQGGEKVTEIKKGGDKREKMEAEEKGRDERGRVKKRKGQLVEEVESSLIGKEINEWRESKRTIRRERSRSKERSDRYL